MTILAKQQILDEFKKCVTDPFYMIETYFQTFDKTNEGYLQAHEAHVQNHSL